MVMVCENFKYLILVSCTIFVNSIHGEIKLPIVNDKVTGNGNKSSIKYDFTELSKRTVIKERQLIAKDIKGYKFNVNKTLTDFVLEGGGQPIRNLIFSTWRSGSSFLGELLSSHPATFYYYEPLYHFGVVQVKGSIQETEAIRVVKNLLTCNYTNLSKSLHNNLAWVENPTFCRGCLMNHHLKNCHSSLTDESSVTYLSIPRWTKILNHLPTAEYLEPGNSFLRKNRGIWKHFGKMEFLQDASHVEKMCKIYPFQTAKCLRMRLKLARPLLKDQGLNVKLVYLVRDPRGTMQSRQHHTWCLKNADCSEPSILCDNLVTDYEEAQKLLVEYPNRFMIIRFEDLSTNIEVEIVKILKFYGLELHQNIKSFVKTHTKQATDKTLHGTTRKSKSVPFEWIKKWKNNVKMITKIQKVCTKAMELWGYNYMKNDTNLNEFNPIKSITSWLTHA